MRWQPSRKKRQKNAEETRKCCLETFAETNSRTTDANDDEDTKKEKRIKQGGNEAINYLREKAKKDFEL